MNREYYEKKKLDLSNRHDSNGKKLGEIIEFTLAPPFTEVEVLDYELKYDFKFPKVIRDYIVNISRETIGRYPYIIEFYEPAMSYLDKDGYCLAYKDDSETDEDLNKRGFYKNYFLEILHNGENDGYDSDYYDYNYGDDDDSICIKGIHYGKNSKDICGKYFSF